jgi:hypothetical protein
LELFDQPPYSPDLAPRDYRLFTCTQLKNWLQSQHFNNNEELMVGDKMWLSSQAADFFYTGIQKLIPHMISASIPAVTALRSNLCMYFLYIIKLFSFIAYFANSSLAVTF